MTRKLFYEDIHMTTFQATVISCDVIGASEKTEENKEPLYRLLLDSTAFFPEEGGQSADIGTINGQDVLDVQIEKDLIYHTVKEPVAVGEIIEGQVNWKQRFDFMQQHSGEHILSGIVHERFGYNNVGFHLSTREVTLDFDGALDSEQLKDIELAANRVIWLNLPIEISYPENSELAALSYRSKIEIDGRVRIVTIPGVDVCACCAPHTETTGQIGILKIVNAQNYKGGVRLTILCGQRALSDYREKLDSVTTIAQSMSVKQEQVVDAFNKLRAENMSLKEAANALQAKCLSLSLTTLPDPSASKHAVLFTDICDNIAIRNAVNDLTGRYEGYCAVFFGTEHNYRFILGSKHLDCNEIAQKFRTGLGAKCGGNSLMIQGSVSSSQTDIAALFQ